jgi:hypothetical protein
MFAEVNKPIMMLWTVPLPGREAPSKWALLDPREEPGALAAQAGICAGGEEKSSSLVRCKLLGE